MSSSVCRTPVIDFSDRNAKDSKEGMPIGKTARIQQADRQFAKHLNQIKKVSENELTREHRSIEEVFRLEMLQHQLEHQAALGLLEKIHRVSHHRDALLKRSFETILERFSFSSVYDSEMTLPPITGVPKHKLLPRTAPGMLGRISEERRGGGRGGGGGWRGKKKANSVGGHSSKRGSLAGSWNKIKITLPRCENETPGTERGGLTSNEPSTSSLLGLSRRIQKMGKIERGGFHVPAYLATKPIPRARDRYLQAMKEKVSLGDIKQCGYLRISKDLT